MKIVIWVHSGPLVLEDVPIHGDGSVACCTWSDDEIRKKVLALVDDAAEVLGIDLRDEIDRAINQELIWKLNES